MLLGPEEVILKANDLFVFALEHCLELQQVLIDCFLRFLLLCCLFIETFKLALALALQNGHPHVFLLQARHLLLLLTDQGQ